MNCFLCNKSNFELHYSLKTKNILRCKNDRLFLSKELFKTVPYGKHYFSNSPNLSNQSYFLKKLLTIKRLTNNASPHILDVGCGWGDFEEVLEQEKIPYLGIDVNQEAIDICRKKGLNCTLKNIDELNGGWPKRKGSRQRGDLAIFAATSSTGGREISGRTRDNKFDSITLFQVIEHLNNPIPLLQTAKKLLKPDGILLITTPNNDSPLRKILGPRWSVYSEPSHYVFYNKTTLQKTLEKADFKNIQVKNDSLRFLSIRYILARLNLLTPNHYNLTPNFPLPTDPFGDIEAVGYN